MFRVDPSSHTPIYEQIVRQIRSQVAAGRLAAGARLPSVRRLAEQLLVNPNTVARSYRELELEGLVISRQGDGVFVADLTSPFRARDRRALVAAAVDRLLAETAPLGASLDELIDALRRRAQEPGNGRQEGMDRELGS